MKYRKLIIRVVALILAVLMGLSVLAVLFNILAVNVGAIETIVQTGDDPSQVKWPLYVGLSALLLIIVLVLVPMFNKKK
ncbi:MAG: hypothetical protein GX345_00860 [Clostridiales bacterium]|nr:hypothetical protein [Clostridiales bacterium]